MKNWTLFMWALRRWKMKDRKYVKCLRNDILLKLMNLSGVTPRDVYILISKN